MKINKVSIFALVLLFLTSCSRSATDSLTWQEQYDLGVRYLSEGNYEEAIIAFTAAIEIDPKKVDAYLSLYDAYVAVGDYETAHAILEQGFAETSDQTIADLLDEIETKSEYGEVLRSIDVFEPARDDDQCACLMKTTFEYFETGVVKEIQYDVHGEIWFENLYDYQIEGSQITCYLYGEIESVYDLNVNGRIATETWFTHGTYNNAEYIIKEYDGDGRLIQWTEYAADDSVQSNTTHTYHTNGVPHLESNYFSDSEWLLEFEFDIEGREIRQTSSYSGELQYDWAFDYDDDGKRCKGANRGADGTIGYYEIYEYDTDGNRVGMTRYTADGQIMS